MRSTLALASLASAAVLLAPATAAADRRATLGDGFELVVTGGYDLEVTHGGRRAPLAHAISIQRASFDRATKLVTVEVEDSSCAGTTTHTWTLGHLEARIENAAAFGLHRKRDYRAAAAGFARAAAADPAWVIPAYNLASAHQLLGDHAAAVKALAPHLAAAPITTYVQVTADPELAPLLARPELVAIRAKQPGTVTLTWEGPDGLVAYAPDRKLVAVGRNERSWGSSAFEQRLEIYTTDGKLVAWTYLVRDSETSNECYDSPSCRLLPRARPVVERRAAKLQQMLRELGFSKVTGERAPKIHGDSSEPKQRIVFPRHKLGLVTVAGAARVLRGNTELGVGKVSQVVTDAMIVDELQAIVAWSLRPGAEGCEGTDPTRVDLIPFRP